MFFCVCVSVNRVLTHVPHVQLKSVPQSRLRQTPLSVASLAVRRVHPRAMMGQRAPLIWLQKLQEASAWRLLTLLGGRGTVQQQTLLKSGSQAGAVSPGGAGLPLLQVSGSVESALEFA